ncbi:hypothetical protein ACGC1H_006571 [Rhizoctonia solani]
MGRGASLLRAFRSTGGIVAIKFNYPPKSREVEAQLLRRAQDAGIPNIIRIIASEELDDTLAGFSPDLVAMLQRFELRQFRILVLSPLCEPFTIITDLNVFKQSFIKLVVAHRALYEIGILHCDVSIGNIMFDPIQQEPYLIDGDLGKFVSNLAGPASSHRTRTLPFMATDLLMDQPPPHIYRHDLESFFYVLIWMCVPNRCGWDVIKSIAEMEETKTLFFLKQ